MPLHSGQAPASAARIAPRMNADRFGIPRMASASDPSALNVMISCFFLRAIRVFDPTI